MGGARAPALVIDVRAPADSLASAVADVKALLLRLATVATEADLTRATSSWDHREDEARADPRRRLTDLWSGLARPPPRDGDCRGGPRWVGGDTTARPSASLAAWRAFLGAALREGALVVVEGRPGR